MATTDDILNLDPLVFDAHWQDIDQIVWALKTPQEQIAAWEAIANRLKPYPVSKGMPFFRLGHMHLVNDGDATKAIDYLEQAYQRGCEVRP